MGMPCFQCSTWKRPMCRNLHTGCSKLVMSLNLTLFMVVSVIAILYGTVVCIVIGR